jgi:hypothetical protein
VADVISLVEVLVCVRHVSDSGGSQLLCMRRSYAVAPQIEDQIEIVPERRDEYRHISAWHERVEDRWLHVTENDVLIEVHVSPAGGRPLDAESLADLIEEGYRKPGER